MKAQGGSTPFFDAGGPSFSAAGELHDLIGAVIQPGFRVFQNAVVHIQKEQLLFPNDHSQIVLTMIQKSTIHLIQNILFG